TIEAGVSRTESSVAGLVIDFHGGLNSLCGFRRQHDAHVGSLATDQREVWPFSDMIANLACMAENGQSARDDLAVSWYGERSQRTSHAGRRTRQRTCRFLADCARCATIVSASMSWLLLSFGRAAAKLFRRDVLEMGGDPPEVAGGILHTRIAIPVKLVS